MVCVFWKLPERHSGQREQLVHRGRNVHWGGCRWLVMATVQSPDVQGAFGEQLGRFWKGDMGTDSKVPSEDFCLSVDIGNSRRPLIQRRAGAAMHRPGAGCSRWRRVMYRPGRGWFPLPGLLENWVGGGHSWMG